MLRYIVITNKLIIHSYNFFIGVGIIFAFLYFDYQAKRDRCNDSYITKLYLAMIFSLIGGFFGGYIFDTIVHSQSLFLMENPGFTFYGGLISGTFIFFLAAIIFRLKLVFSLNLIVPSLVLAHAFGRIGCFLGGCCFGKATKTLFGILFPPGSLPALKFGVGVRVFPTQLYEAFFLFCLFLILTKTKVIPFINRAAVYLILYGSFRFFLEYLRGDDRGIIFGQLFLSPSQIISLSILTIGVMMLLWHKIVLKRISKSLEKATVSSC